jgi:S-adenosylmethionine synthetase, C-terminal domain
VPVGGGALCGKDPHKVDKSGSLRARQLAKRLLRKGVDEARVTLGWSPGAARHLLIGRHPIYTGVMFVSLGWALVWQSWPALLTASGAAYLFWRKRPGLLGKPPLEADRRSDPFVAIFSISRESAFEK